MKNISNSTETNHTQPKNKSFHSNLISLASKTLIFIKSIFSRYFGIKNETGYNFYFEKTLTRNEAASYLQYVSAAAYGFTGKSEEFLYPLGWTPILPTELEFKDPELLPTHYAYFNKKTGLKISLMEKGNEVLLAIPGLLFSAGNENNETTRDYFNGCFRDPAKIINIAGGVPYVYLEAEQAILSLMEEQRLKGKKITLVGQCFGGSIAAYTAIKRGIRAICLNSLQLGAGLQAEIGEESLKKADQYVTHICVERDWLTTSKIIQIIDRILTYLHIRTPGNFGKKYLIPSAYRSSVQSHGFVLGSFMAYLGHDKRATPKTLMSQEPRERAVPTDTSPQIYTARDLKIGF